MAKKTESTAVNDLINLVATQGPSVKDPGADLFSEPPKKSARMTSTVPPLKGAGAVEPLPRTRAPLGTQQNASVNPPVRVSTAMPRANSIPPLPGGRGRPALPPPRASATMPRPPIPTSAKIAVPAPASLDVDVEVDGDIDDIEAEMLKTPVVSQPRKVTPLNVAPVVAPVAAVAPVTLPSADPIYPRAERSDHPNAAPDMTGAAPWFEDSRAVDRLSIPDASHSMAENTAQVQRPASSTLDLVKKLAIPMGIAIVLGVVVGGYIVFDGQGGKKRADAAPVAASTDTDDIVAPAVAMPTAESTDEPASAGESMVKAVEPTNTNEPASSEPTQIAAASPSVLGGAVDSLPTTARTATKPVFVDVRFDSTPSGATVMLVDRGKTTFLGTTPINASVDPARRYDVVFTYANKPTQVEHLDPKTTQRLAVILGKSGNQNEEVAKPAPKAEKAIAKVDAPKAIAKVEAPKAGKKAVTTKGATKPAAKVAEPFEDDTAALQKKLAEKKAAKVEKTEPKVEAKAEAKAATDEPKAEKAVAKAGGMGTLMISSKPPCEIWVDGTSTGLMTPQRAIPLPAGKHKITLVSPDKAYKKTVAVEITADKPTKVIQDLLK